MHRIPIKVCYLFQNFFQFPHTFLYFNKRTVLHEAVENENIDIIKLLLEQKEICVDIKDEIFNHFID